MTYKCEYCGSEYEGANCPYCGASHPSTPVTKSDTTNSDNTNSHITNNYITYTSNSYKTDTTTFIPKNKKRVEEKAWFVILMLFLLFPVGLFFMWKNNVFKLLTRIIITLFFAVIIYSMVKTDGTTDTTNTAALDNEKAVEVTVTNTPTPALTSTPASTPTPTSTPSPTPAKKTVSKKEKFIKEVTGISGVNTKTAGNLYDLFHKKMGFSKVDIIRKSDTGKATYDFNADDFTLMVAFKNEKVSAIKCGFYTLYDGKEVKIDKQGILDRRLVDDVKYYHYAKEIIEDNIKTPKTAQFPDIGSSDVRMQRNGDLVAVQGYFDAQNTYGALVRSNYTVEFSVTDLDANLYKAVYINIDDKIKGKWVELD